jgi:hypothetical protein
LNLLPPAHILPGNPVPQRFAAAAQAKDRGALIREGETLDSARTDTRLAQGVAKRTQAPPDQRPGIDFDGTFPARDYAERPTGLPPENTRLVHDPAFDERCPTIYRRYVEGHKASFRPDII